MTQQAATTNGSGKDLFSTFEKLFNDRKETIKRTVQAHNLFSTEEFIRLCLQAISKQPKLLKCTPQSLWIAASQAAELGLKPGTALGLCHFQPNNNWNPAKQAYVMEATLIIGYRGYIELARRSGDIESVQARLIFRGDKYDIDYARVDRPIEHKPNLEAEDSGEWIAAYSIARLKSSPYPIVEVMTRKQVMKIRDKVLKKMKPEAKAYSPWMTDDEEMARKTVIRRAQKYWPLSEALEKAGEIDSEAMGGNIDELLAESEAEEATPQPVSGVDKAKRAVKGALQQANPANQVPPAEPAAEPVKTAAPADQAGKTITVDNDGVVQEDDAPNPFLTPDEGGKN